MKLTVNKYLNARQGAPSTAAPNPMYHNPGTILTIDKVHAGTAIQGNSIWYHCPDDGYFYWSGGFAEDGFDLKPENKIIDIKDADPGLAKALVESVIPKFIEKYSYSYSGVGSGDTNHGLDIVISVADRKDLLLSQPKLQESIIFNGYTIGVRVMEQEKFTADANIYSDQVLPLVMGGSVGNQATGATGTRGLKLEYNKETVLLTCYHVACDNLLKNKITSYNNSDITVRLPSLKSGSGVGYFSGKVIAGQLGGYIDYALVRVTNDVITSNILTIGIPEAYYSALDSNDLSVGKTLKTFGCISRKSIGKITKAAVSSSYVYVTYKHIGDLKVYGTIETEKISVEGDSGAVVVDDSNKIVGIIIASNSTNSLVMPYYRLLNLHALKLLNS